MIDMGMLMLLSPGENIVISLQETDNINMNKVILYGNKNSERYYRLHIGL